MITLLQETRFAVRLRGSGLLMLPGLIVGLMLAAGVARLTQAVVLDVNAPDPLVSLGVALTHGVIVVLACIGPALRASRLDPVVALRTD